MNFRPRASDDEPPFCFLEGDAAVSFLISKQYIHTSLSRPASAYSSLLCASLRRLRGHFFVTRSRYTSDPILLGGGRKWVETDRVSVHECDRSNERTIFLHSSSLTEDGDRLLLHNNGCPVHFELIASCWPVDLLTSGRLQFCDLIKIQRAVSSYVSVRPKSITLALLHLN